MRITFVSSGGSLIRWIRSAAVLTGILAFIGSSAPVSAVSLTAWDFDGNDGDEASVAATSVGAGFVSSTVTRSAALYGLDIPDSFSAESWSPSGTLDSTLYFEFSVIPDSGTTYTITSIDLNLVLESFGPNQWALRSDADAYAANLDLWTVFPDNTVDYTFASHTTFLPSTSDFENLTTARTFRLYAFNSSGGEAGVGGMGGLGDDIVINGTVDSGPPSNVPDALPFGAFSVVLGMLYMARLKLRRSR